jgi:ABC-type glutathione transport system ATPase component
MPRHRRRIGSGKSTLANMILGIYRPSEGEIRFAGTFCRRGELAHRRAIQLVQQNPASALNPRRNRGGLAAAGARRARHRRPKAQRWRASVNCWRKWACRATMRTHRPRVLSGGQRQRVAIARALACQSELVVLDEPTSALDVLVQARVLKLLDDLRRRRGLTYIFITHDLSVVRNIADRVAVFEARPAGRAQPDRRLFADPDHPYTRRLIGAVPVVTDAEAALRARLARRSIKDA